MKPKLCATPADVGASGQPDGALSRLVGSVGRRLRLQRVCSALSYATTLALALAGPASLRLRWCGRGDLLGTGLCGLALALPVAAVLVQLLAQDPPEASARLADRVAGLSDLLSSAWDFARRDPAVRSSFMRAAVARAEQTASTLDARSLVPLRVPAVVRVWPLLALGVASVWVGAKGAAGHAPHPDPRPQHGASLERVAQAGPPPQLGPASSAAALQQALDHALSRFAAGDLDRLNLLRTLDQVEQRARQLAVDPARSPQLQALGQLLARQRPTHAFGAALERGDLTLARSTLRALATRARAAGQRRQLDHLERALRTALQRHARAVERERARRQLDHLERDRPHSTPPGLNERLEQERARRALQRELEQLTRELARAGAGSTTAGLQGADAPLQRMQQAQRQAHQAQRLRERIAEVRAGLGQQPMAARDAPRDASPARSTPLTLHSVRATPVPEPAGRRPEQPPAGVVVRPQGTGGGNQVPPRAVPLGSQGRTPSPSAEGGPTIGSATAARASHHDVAPGGTDGPGPTRSAVIYDAAAHGFASRAYAEVHADYARHAERELQRDALSLAERMYVHRYFQLISPEVSP